MPFVVLEVNRDGSNGIDLNEFTSAIVCYWLCIALLAKSTGTSKTSKFCKQLAKIKAAIALQQSGLSTCTNLKNVLAIAIGRLLPIKGLIIPAFKSSDPLHLLKFNDHVGTIIT